MAHMILDDPILIQKACQMKDIGMFVSDISKILTEETGEKITQMSLWRLFNSLKEETKKQLTELDYPSRNEIEELFSELLQKQENRICIYGGKQLKRNVMIEILNKFHNKEFNYSDVETSLYKTSDKEAIYQHWRYLLEGNYIEKVDDYKFKFCDRVKKRKVGFF
jgi:DNA-binding transcriptional MerR regulator